MTCHSLKQMLILAAFAWCVSLPAHADGGGGGGRDRLRPADPNYTEAQRALEEGRYEEALRHLLEAQKGNPDDADVQNLLGFAYRKQGDVDKAFLHYRRALALEPKHLGANEYLGELYVEQGDIASAEKHLNIMRKSFSCLSGCEQARDLKKAIQAYRAEKGA